MASIDIRIAGALAVAALAFPGAPLAAMMTFSGLGNGSGPGTTQPYVENGISATTPGSGTLGYAGGPGAAHLDDSGTSFASTIAFTMASPFDFVSLDLMGFGTSYTNGTDNIAYDNVLFEGYRGGTLVAQKTFSTGITSGTFDITSADLGAGFVDLEEFRIASVQPSSLKPDFSCGAPCGHFSVDNLTLSTTPLRPVPLPAALPMLLIGIGTLMAAGVGLRARA